MGGRAWSQEELIQLEELTETYPLATVARKLNRSENAVFLKRQRTGIGGFMANTDMLTRNTLSRILGVENRTIQYWERKGLKSVRKKPYVMYRQQDIIRYMKEHPEDWNAARVTDDTLFMQYPWFKEKRKNDISHKYNWTQTEVSESWKTTMWRCQKKKNLQHLAGAIQWSSTPSKKGSRWNSSGTHATSAMTKKEKTRPHT